MLRINLLTQPWKKLSLTYRNKDAPFLFRGIYYKTMYNCLYAHLFPSRRMEMETSPISRLRELKLSLEKFEITEEEAFNLLMEMIDVKYNNDIVFNSLLHKAKDYKLMNYDYNDYYFGYPRNIYGIALTKYRNAHL